MQILYGGTFDPVHLGHLAIALAVARAFSHEVTLVPSADPPHRPPPGASAAQRAEMLALAVRGEPALRVDRRELDRQGPSFTVDTLAQLRAELGPGEPLVWVLGLDSVVQLASWHDWRRLFELANLLGVQRPGTEPTVDWLRGEAPLVHGELADRWRQPADLAQCAHGAYAALPIQPLRAESGTRIRAGIATGEAWRGQVPAAVADYIASAGLYRPGSPGQGV